MYYVIIWDQYCSVVPDIWINLKEKTCAYPSSGINVTNAIKKRINATDDWDVCNYRQILGPYNTYEKAREAEKTCIDLSTSDESQLVALCEPKQTLPAKRLITKKRFYDDSDENEETHNRKFIMPLY